MNENQRGKLQGFNQYRHKTLQILKNLIFSSFVLIQKKQKIKAYTSRRPANGSTVNRINVSLRLTEFRFNALFAERVPRLRSLCRFYLLINFCSCVQVNFFINQHAEKLIAR
jgi:hypothetical protein